MIGVETVVPLPVSTFFPTSLSGSSWLKRQSCIDAQNSIGFRYLKSPAESTGQWMDSE